MFSRSAACAIEPHSPTATKYSSWRSVKRSGMSRPDVSPPDAAVLPPSPSTEPQYLIQTVFSAVYLSKECSDRSRPKPDCFIPPNGVIAESASTVLTDTVPATSRSETSSAARSRVQTEAASP